MVQSTRLNLSHRDKHKHHSKLYLGYLKQVADQDAKPTVSSVDTGLISWDEEEGVYLPLKQKFYNNKWNGMNLKNLLRDAYKPSGLISFHGNFTINPKTGKYHLAHGAKRKLAKLREKRIQRLNSL